MRRLGSAISRSAASRCGNELAPAVASADRRNKNEPTRIAIATLPAAIAIRFIASRAACASWIDSPVIEVGRGARVVARARYRQANGNLAGHADICIAHFRPGGAIIALVRG